MKKMKKMKLIGLVFLAFVLMSGIIDLDNLFNYSNQLDPDYINPFFDNAPSDNQMDDKIATLGRVLFYDKTLSSDNSVSCSSCHDQEHAFGVLELQGQGVNGLSLRRPMRLVNLRFKEPGEGFFWDQRTETLEDLAVQPIQDHIEMGYSGQNGDPSIDDLITELEQIDYYNELFEFAFGNNSITEERMGKAIAQFLRSMQSFDSKFDEGIVAIGGGEFVDLEADFPNFTVDENAGKTLFYTSSELSGIARIGGGVNCFVCHSGPGLEFVIENGNNGVITEINGDAVFDISKAPTLRDIFGPNGELNGPLFHNGQATSLNEVFNHYNEVEFNSTLNANIPLLGSPMNISTIERQQLEAFLKTLTGVDIYTNEKWSDPFDGNGNITITGGTVGVSSFLNNTGVEVYPNPAINMVRFKGLKAEKEYFIKIINTNGQLMFSDQIKGNESLNLSNLPIGILSIQIFDELDYLVAHKKVIKR